MSQFKIGQNFDPITCRKIGPMIINPCNTKKIFPEYSFHINFRKIQEKSSKLNDSVKSYNKKMNREEGAITIADLVTFTEKSLMENFIFCTV